MQQFVVIYLIDKKTNKVYYLKKNRPNMYQLHDKLVGWGGKIEKNETPIQAIVREIKEELNLELIKTKIIELGQFYDEINNLIYVYKYFLDKKLKEGIIENEGIASYKPINYHITNSEEFPKINLKFQDLILFSNKKFKLDFRK